MELPSSRIAESIGAAHAPSITQGNSSTPPQKFSYTYLDLFIDPDPRIPIWLRIVGGAALPFAPLMLLNGCSNGNPAGRSAETDAGYISDDQSDGVFVDQGIVDTGTDAIPYEELKVRINFLEFFTDHSSAAGDDYLFDIEIKSEEREDCRAQGRTGHSRFVQPEHLDLNLPKTCSGELVKVNIFGYWHLSDILIDIDPEPSHGYCLHTSIVNPEGPEGCYLSLEYMIGSTLEGDVDGNNDGFLADPFDGFLRYKIETLF